MAPIKPMLDELELELVQKIETDEDQVLTQHSVPALEGDFLQGLGRRATQVTLTGVLTGAEAGEGLKKLREKFRNAEPVPFVADIATATKVDKVLIEEMGVRDLAGKPKRFEYALTLREFIPPPPTQTEPPPPPPPVPPPPSVDSGILVVEVEVEGQPNFDFSKVTVTVEGTKDDGSALTMVLSDRDNNKWTEKDMALGQYTVNAVVTDPPAMSGSAPATVRAGQEERVKITLRPGVTIAKAFIVHFTIDKAFMEPCMREVLRQVAQYASDHTDEKLVIVGHTDLVGSAEYNQSLSERRGRSIYAFLTFGREREATLAEWNALRQPADGQIPSIKDNWGTREYQYMLQDLGYYSGNVDGDHGPMTDAAVRAFQQDKGLTVNGIVGDQTWAALIEGYLSQDALAVPESQFFPNCAGEIMKWLGCGEQDAVKNTEDAWRPNRRVELLFVRADRLPCEVAKPVTFDLPAPGAVGSNWCLGLGDPNSRCCFITREAEQPSKWLVQPAEPGTIIVRGSIKFEDGTPAANVKYVLIAPDGEFMDGERPSGPARGKPIPGRTAADGTFDYPDKLKGIGVYTLEIQGPFVARLAGEPPEAAKGSVVCKRLDGTSDLDVIVMPLLDDPSKPGPFPVGEHEYTEGTFTVPEQTETLHEFPPETPSEPPLSVTIRPFLVTRRALVRYPAESAGVDKPVSTRCASYPLVVLAHGNHRSLFPGGGRVESFRGLEYLARHLASHGYIAVSIDLDDMNIELPAGSPASRSPAILQRGLTILEHIAVMANRNATGPIFSGKVDLSQIGLVGHSRGGEAVVAAQKINIDESRGHLIKGVVSIAPTDFLGIVHTTTPYLVIYGSADGDVDNGWPFRLYDRAAAPKSMIFVYGGIHNRFSAHPDWIGPGRLDSADSRMISVTEHHNIAKGYCLAFFELLFRGQNGYAAYFKRYGRPANVATVELHHQFQDPARFVVDDFEQGILDRTLPLPPQLALQAQNNTLGQPAATTGLAVPTSFSDARTEASLRRRDLVFFWHETIGAMVAWDSTAGVYTTGLGNRDVSSFQVLAFRVTQRFDSSRNPNPPGLTLGAPQDFFVGLVDSTGQSAFVRVGTVTSIPFPYKRSDNINLTKSALKTIRIPLSVFKSLNTRLNLRSVQSVVFQFRQTATGEIAIDDIEFSN